MILNFKNETVTKKKIYEVFVYQDGYVWDNFDNVSKFTDLNEAIDYITNKLILHNQTFSHVKDGCIDVT